MRVIRRVRTAPAAVVRRLGVNVARYQHARRRAVPDEELLRRALRDGASLEGFLATVFAERWFWPARDAPAIAAELAAAVPGWVEQTRADADRVCRRVVRILGEDELDLDKAREPDGALPWHRDLIHDYAWDPGTFYRQVPIPYDRADIRVPWELSRAQHLPVLGMAYAATEEARYADEALAQIDDWIQANPVGYGVNWSCTMDVAIRAVNWLWALHLVAGTLDAADPRSARVVAALVRHARHIARNIERYDRGVTTNHTLADYVGLAYLGIVLADLPEAAAWAHEGLRGAWECMEQQVLPDGADFENSIPYHRLVLEMFAGCSLLARRNGHPLPPAYEASLERMFEFVLHYTRPDGLAPLVGDADDGRLQILSRYFDWAPQDHRYLLGLGAAIYGRADLASAPADAPGAREEAAWLLGPGAVRRLEALPAAEPLRSRAFRASGRYVMRDGGHHVLICADEVGTAGMGNHKHNDLLSFELSVAGAAMVVDGGSFQYTGDLAWRDRFRSTRAHSTAMVDGTEQNELAGPFGMRSDARVHVEVWHSDGDADVFRAHHSGYERLPAPVTHERTIVLLRPRFALLVADRFSGSGDHRLESFLQLAPDGEVRTAPSIAAGAVSEALEAAGAAAGLEALPEPRLSDAVAYLRAGREITVVPLGWRRTAIEAGWFAPRYGRRVQRSVVRHDDSRQGTAMLGALILSDGGAAWS